MSRQPLLAVTPILPLLALPTRGQPTEKATTRPVLQKIPHTTVQIEMVRVPGGEFTLKESDGRETTYDIRPFLIQRTEARWDEWDVFYLGLDLGDVDAGVKANERRHAMPRPSPSSYFDYDHGFGHHDWPVEGITLNAVRAYIEWLNHTTGKRFRLPTEVEWLYACQAGSVTPVRPKGEALDRVAWFGNSDEGPHRVAAKAPNPWGLYDMLGNVGEWVIRSDECAVLAGGSFKDEAQEVHSGAREIPDIHAWQRTRPELLRPVQTWLSDGTHVGFRLVRDSEPGEE